MLRKSAQRAQEMHVTARKERERTERYGDRLRRQQSLLRRLARAMVSVGFGELLNTILNEHRLE